MTTSILLHIPPKWPIYYKIPGAVCQSQFFDRMRAVARIQNEKSAQNFLRGDEAYLLPDSGMLR